MLHLIFDILHLPSSISRCNHLKHKFNFFAYTSFACECQTFCGASRLPTVVREYNGFKFEPLAFSVYF